MTPLPSWFKEAWIIVLITPRGRKRRQITYWTRAKYDRMVPWWRSKGARVLYAVHVSRPRRAEDIHPQPVESNPNV